MENGKANTRLLLDLMSHGVESGRCGSWRLLTTGEPQDKHGPLTALSFIAALSLPSAAAHTSAALIMRPVEINGPRHIWGPICLSYHSSERWPRLSGRCQCGTVRAARVIDLALRTDRWSMSVGGAMDLSPFPRLCELAPPQWCMWCLGEEQRMSDTSRPGRQARSADWERLTHTGTWHYCSTDSLLFNTPALLTSVWPSFSPVLAQFQSRFSLVWVKFWPVLAQF